MQKACGQYNDLEALHRNSLHSPARGHGSSKSYGVRILGFLLRSFHFAQHVCFLSTEWIICLNILAD